MKIALKMFIVFTTLLSSYLFAQEGVTNISGNIFFKLNTPLEYIHNHEGTITTNLQWLNSVCSNYEVTELNSVFSKTTGEFPKYYKMVFSSSTTVSDMLALIRQESGVTGAWEYPIITSDDDPEEDPDPLYSSQWGLQKIQAPQAWTRTSGKNSVLVGIVDTGIDLIDPETQNFSIHPDFSSVNLWNENGKYGVNFLSQSDYPHDGDVGHGTHIAGIIAGNTNNGINISGVAGGGYNSETGVKLLILKTVSASSGHDAQTDANAIVFAVDNGAKILNLSWGFQFWEDCPGEGGYNPTVEDPVKLSIKYAYEHGVVIVAAMGNFGIDFSTVNCGGGVTRQKYVYPAEYATYDVISVANTNSSDYKYSSSAYANWCTISAPGASILSDYPRAINSNGYAYNTGTSMSAPHVTGVAALILSLAPNASAKMIKNILTSTADNIDTQNQGTDWYGKLGAGRVNANNALNLIAANPTAPSNLSVAAYSYYPKLSWSLSSSADIASYEVWRRSYVNPNFPTEWQNISTVNGFTSTFVDQDIYLGNGSAGYVQYYIRAKDVLNQYSEFSNTTEIAYAGFYKSGGEFTSIPTELRLIGNFPNPFNPNTTISFGIPSNQLVSLKIFNSIGQEVEVLANKEFEAGYHNVNWNASKYSSGVYLCQLQVSGHSETIKLIIQK